MLLSCHSCSPISKHFSYSSSKHLKLEDFWPFSLSSSPLPILYSYAFQKSQSIISWFLPHSRKNRWHHPSIGSQRIKLSLNLDDGCPCKYQVTQSAGIKSFPTRFPCKLLLSPLHFFLKFPLQLFVKHLSLFSSWFKCTDSMNESDLSHVDPQRGFFHCIIKSMTWVGHLTSVYQSNVSFSSFAHWEFPLLSALHPSGVSLMVSPASSCVLPWIMNFPSHDRAVSLMAHPCALSKYLSGMIVMTGCTCYLPLKWKVLWGHRWCLTHFLDLLIN